VTNGAIFIYLLTNTTFDEAVDNWRFRRINSVSI